MHGYNQTSDIYVFIREPKSCSHFITNGAKLRLSYKYIDIRSLVITYFYQILYFLGQRVENNEVHDDSWQQQELQQFST
jgi:hypothetical protein